MNDFIVTFPMFLSGGLTLFISGFWFWVNRQNANDKEARDQATKERELKEAEIHESFAAIHEEMAERRDKIHRLEMALQATIRREEMDRIWGRMEDMRKEIGEDMRSMTAQVISSLAALLQRKDNH